jgi:predicted transposase YbfD/YdcC
MIDVVGSTVTINAMGCKQSIAEEILIQRANYVLILKDNQPKLYEMVKAIFDIGESRQYKKMLNRRKERRFIIMAVLTHVVIHWYQRVMQRYFNFADRD